MSKQTHRPPLNPSVESLRRHFRERAIDKPGPLDNPDSLAFQAVHEQQGHSAAVLIPIVETAGGLELLLTRRADHLKQHPGQISFPGGRIEPHDHSLVETALRETEEEIGLSRAETEVLGEIGSVYTITGFHVTPVIGLLQDPLELTPDPNEVAEVIMVPFSHLMNPAIYERLEHRHETGLRTYYSTEYNNHRIWGVTAGIIVGLYEELQASHSGE